MKGILDIKVFDKNGKLKQHLNEKNMLTKYTEDEFKSGWASPELRALGWSTSPIFFSDINNGFNGILLFNNNLLENENNYFKQLMTANVVGHADSLGYTYSSSKYGVLNETASETTKNSITKVWNFGQGIASGTINSVALTTNNLGRSGLYDTEMDNVNKMINDDFPKYGNKISGSSGTEVWINLPYRNSLASSGNYFLGYKDKKLYFYTVLATVAGLTITIKYVDYNDCFAKKDFNTSLEAQDLATISMANGQTSKTISSLYTMRLTSSFYNNKFYFLAPSTQTDKVEFVAYDLETELSNQITANINSSYRYNYFVVNSQGVYMFSIADGTKIGRFSQNLEIITDITVDSEFEQTYPYLDSVFMNANDSGLFYLRRGNKACLTDFYDYKFLTKNSVPSHIFLPDEFNGLFGFAILNDGTQLRKFDLGISTIKNLSKAVTKTSTDEMVVTYKIIKDESIQEETEE